MPRVAILGRPNVGKSTLFNALIGRRRAITHQRPGVTRDTIEAPWRVGGRTVTLVDTGGFTAGGEGLSDLVAERSLREAQIADAALLVLDAAETTAEDEDLVHRLRPLADRVVLVVNKVDTPEREPLVWNRLALGFPDVVGVSAAHRRNLEAIADAVAPLVGGAEAGPPSAREQQEEAVTGEIRIAVLGKPNTGKSSLTNRLLGRERSIVSEVPGTTRDVVVGTFRWRGARFRVLDTAGIRRRTHVTDDIEYYSVSRAMESVRECDLVFLLIDAREELSTQDKKIAALAAAEGRGMILVLNKSDLLDRDACRAAVERVRFRFPLLAYAPVIAVSARTGAGLGRLLVAARELADQLARRVATGQLNQAVERWTAQHPLRGRRAKVHYLVQVETNPVRFLAFVNRLADFPADGVAYLENCIRREFGFVNVPVRVELRQSVRRQAR